MICNLDAAQLEWRVCVHNSQDKIGIEEINNGLDFHSDNQKKFTLPSRLVAKKFLFRNIFCPWWIADRTAYAYSVDNEFKSIGGVKFWRNAIDRFYEKYEGIYKYHLALKREATSTGQIVSNSGRIYKFEPRLRRGEMEWPDSDIVNYPVQGFSHDLMTLARVSAYNRLKEERKRGEVLFVNTVHDSIMLDLNCDIRRACEIGRVVKSSFESIPANYERIYGEKFLVPMSADFKVGNNALWLHEIKL
jgi:hypothetical protein